MKEVILNENVKIYICKIKDYDSEELKKQIKLNLNFSQLVESTTNKLAGKQSLLIIDSNEITTLKQKCLNFLNVINDNIKEGLCYTRNWFYINDANSKERFFHEHTKNKEIPSLDIEWTYTFYIQMPNNLQDIEGCITFKTNDNKTHSILPEEGDLIIFPSNLLHTPELSPNSTKERIVMGGVYTKLDINKSYTKKEKTFI
jgi:hypothetical protein